MADCEAQAEAYEGELADMVSDWDDFNDADDELESAATDFWIATAVTWAAAVTKAEGYLGELLGYGSMAAAEQKFDDAAMKYNREWGDLSRGFRELQDAASEYCDCLEGP